MNRKWQPILIIEQIINYIELNITRPINLTEISNIHNISPFYLHKLFHSLTGETMGVYIRNRKLCSAARDLLNTDLPIIELAFDYGYSTHEAFSRAFKKYFHISPLQYRKRKIHPYFLHKNELNFEELKRRIEKINIKPEIKEAAPISVTGRTYTSFINNQQIYQYFEDFLLSIHNYSHTKEKKIYNIFINDPGTNIKNLTESTHYQIMIGLEDKQLKDRPGEMKNYVIDSGQYAIFELNDISIIGDIYLFIYNSWLPSSDYKLAEKCDFLTANLDSNNHLLNISIYIPII